MSPLALFTIVLNLFQVNDPSTNRNSLPPLCLDLSYFEHHFTLLCNLLYLKEINPASLDFAIICPPFFDPN